MLLVLLILVSEREESSNIKAMPFLFVTRWQMLIQITSTKCIPMGPISDSELQF